MSARGIGIGSQIPVLLKVAKLENSLDIGGSVPDVEVGDITFDKETDEVVLIYAIDIIVQNLNGMGTGTEFDIVVSRDLDETAVDLDDEDVMFAQHGTKSFVTSGMQLIFPNLLKHLVHPLITSRPRVRIVAQATDQAWTTGLVNVYVYYTTRKLDAEARRVLIGVE